MTTQDTSEWSAVWSFEVEGYAGIGDEFTNESVEIYPNPSNGNFSILINDYASSEFDITIIDLTGKIILQETYISKSGENELNIRLSDVSNGLYMLNIRKGDKNVTRKLFID